MNGHNKYLKDIKDFSYIGVFMIDFGIILTFCYNVIFAKVINDSKNLILYGSILFILILLKSTLLIYNRNNYFYKSIILGTSILLLYFMVALLFFVVVEINYTLIILTSLFIISIILSIVCLLIIKRNIRRYNSDSKNKVPNTLTITVFLLWSSGVLDSINIIQPPFMVSIILLILIAVSILGICIYILMKIFVDAFLYNKHFK